MPLEEPHGERAVVPGERFILMEPDTGYAYLVHADGKGARKLRGLGVFDPDRLVGTPFGTILKVGAKDVAVLQPTGADLATTIARKAQIITPKDASRIIFELGIGAGDRVFESGVGSGAATVSLCWAVGAEGQVVAQELREEFAKWAQANADAAGLGARLAIAIGDTSQGIAPGVGGPFRAALLDLPEPWLAIRHLLAHLAPGATIACYTPQVSQLEETVRTLRAAGFVQVRALELIERQWEVKERGSRPSFDGLGHTGFLVFARWLGRPYTLPPNPPPPAAVS
ncbi:MAG: tRNA (adenine-N1)-methyltransferase [bacterium]